MTRAGLGKVEISTSAIGAELMGYADRDGGAVAVHDPLFVRALVLECGGERVALCSVDLCAVNEDDDAACWPHGQPGEVFAETGVGLRRELREAGVRHLFVVGYANGWRAYLAPRSAYSEGGYEVDWAVAIRHPETLQDDIRALVVGALAR